MIALEQADLSDKVEILEQQRKVIEKKVLTSKKLLTEIRNLVRIGIPTHTVSSTRRPTLELEAQLTGIDLEVNRATLEAEKNIKQLRIR